MVSKSSWAICCSMLSLFGFFFLLVIGIMFKTQPEYIKGKKSSVTSAPVFESAFLYGAVFVVSTLIWFQEQKKLTGTKGYAFDGAHAEERKPLLENAEQEYDNNIDD